MIRNTPLTPTGRAGLSGSTSGAVNGRHRLEKGLSPAMYGKQSASGLQAVLLNERARFLRFLSSRGAQDEAEDLLHELWQRLSGAPGYPVADPVSYIFRAAENLMRDLRRSRVSRERRQFDWNELASGPEEQPGGERILIARERLRLVEEALERLGPRIARVFRSYRIDGVSQKLIAEELGISLSSVEKDLQKAYRAVAEVKARFDAE